MPIPFSADLPDPGIEPGSPALQVDFFTHRAIREAQNINCNPGESRKFIHRSQSHALHAFVHSTNIH